MRGRSSEQIERLIADEANLADAFLHPQDRAYTVPQLQALLQGAGLSAVSFTNFRRTVRLEYEPEIYVTDGALKRELAARPLDERQAIAELLHGHMSLHTVYATRARRDAASFRDREMVPFFLTAPGAEAAQRLRRERKVQVALSSRVIFAMAPAAATLACLARVDGVRTLEEIWRAAAAELGERVERIADTAAAGLDRLNALNWLCLRHRSCPPAPALAYGYRLDAVVASPGTGGGVRESNRA
jgi:hypothetical protein